MPLPTPTSAPYWEVCAAMRSGSSISPSLDGYVFYPRVLAPGTLADDLQWRQISGAGTLVSFAVAAAAGRTAVRRCGPPSARQWCSGTKVHGWPPNSSTSRRQRYAVGMAVVPGIRRSSGGQRDPAALHRCHALTTDRMEDHVPLALTDEQTALTAAVAGFIDRHAPRTATRPLFDAWACGERPAFWNALVAQGFHAVHLPETVGGGGGGFMEAACVLDAAGHALLPGPLLQTVIAGAVVATSQPSTARNEFLEDIAAGTRAAVVSTRGRTTERVGMRWRMDIERRRRP